MEVAGVIDEELIYKWDFGKIWDVQGIGQKGRTWRKLLEGDKGGFLKDIIGYGRRNEGISVRKRIHQRAQCHQ